LVASLGLLHPGILSLEVVQCKGGRSGLIVIYTGQNAVRGKSLVPFCRLAEPSATEIDLLASHPGLSFQRCDAKDGLP